MRRIEDEAARMGVLVEDLLTLARLDEIADAPHAELDLAALAARRGRRRARDRARPRDRARAPTAPRAVLGDAHQLRQVLGNLLRNALVHTPAGHADRGDAWQPAPDVVRLEVRDHGPGLPTDDADALFERFWRAEGGRERGKGGAGLGLAIVAGDRRRPRRARARAPSADGGGAAFVVDAARAQARQPALSRLPGSRRAPHARAPRLGP